MLTGVVLLLIVILNGSVLTATLSLIIHLWFQMRGAFSDAKAWTMKLRTFACQLFGISPTHSNNLLRAMDNVDLLLVILTCIWDILLVVTFVSYHRVFRQVNMGSIMSLSVLVHLSVFCSF
ncbi:hypothetical protein JB92DRAFT_3217119 [Gautieria morchelliformis]|nr:hypothetical protein JB92DRAFT_3217119 [Gautieria morchelliformis]